MSLALDGLASLKGGYCFQMYWTIEWLEILSLAGWRTSVGEELRLQRTGLSLAGWRTSVVAKGTGRSCRWRSRMLGSRRRGSASKGPQQESFEKCTKASTTRGASRAHESLNKRASESSGRVEVLSCRPIRLRFVITQCRRSYSKGIGSSFD